MISGYKLRNEDDFERAMKAGRTVSVWQKGYCMDDGGAIQWIASDAVIINGARYDKVCNEFRIV